MIYVWQSLLWGIQLLLWLLCFVQDSAALHSLRGWTPALGALIKIGLTNQTSPIYLPDPPFNDHEGLRARAYWSQLFTIIATMPINYLVNKLWTFRAIKDADPAGGE